MLRACWGIVMVLLALGCGAPPVCRPVMGFEGSRLRGMTLTSGAPLSCEDARLDAPMTARAAFPPALRPVVEVHFSPRLDDTVEPLAAVEWHRPSGAFLVGGTASPGIWRHELAHLVMAGPRPSAPMDQRLAAALEEGTADYLAAHLGHDPVVGGVRDLRAPPAARPGAWEGLAMPGLPFEAHALGWGWGAALWAAPVAPEALVACFTNEAAWSGGAGGVQGAIERFVARCPASAQTSIRVALARWVPTALAPARTGR